MAQLAEIPRADMLAKLEEYNSHLTNGRSQCKLSSLQEESGTTVIQGPLRIYWGLDSPIQLKQTDDVSPVPAPPTSTTWRHSYFQAVTNGNISPEKTEPKPKIPESPARSKLTRGLDDSALLSPTSEASPVVLRRNRGLRKFNTVAYRGDQGNRWKRASINGHIYNHDTRVFVPVVGSCTSVTVTSAMPTADVIKTLLEKFKVENQAYEFSLHIVPDKGEPRLLRDSDFPLVERLSIGCDEKLGKIFIREKTIPEVPVEAWKTLTLPEAVERLPAPDVSLTEVTELTELTEKKEQLPEEVEQLANLPEAVLRGFLQKFKNDEEQEVKKIQRKYELAKYMVRKRMKESQA